MHRNTMLKVMRLSRAGEGSQHLLKIEFDFNLLPERHRTSGSQRR